MAKLVNVIQDGDGPRDLYTEIVNDLESAWITEASIPKPRIGRFHN